MPASRLARVSSMLKKAFMAVWLMVLIVGITAWFVYPNQFTGQNIATYLAHYQASIWIAYFVMSALRGFTLLPSTPLVIAGALLFPDQPYSVLAVSLSGILISSTMIYLFSEHLGFAEYFENHKPEATHTVRAKLERPFGLVFVALWAFFPLVPTDLVCYVAGTIRMQFFRFIAAVFVGELVLCSVYVFGGGAFWRP